MEAYIRLFPNWTRGVRHYFRTLWAAVKGMPKGYALVPATDADDLIQCIDRYREEKKAMQ